MPIVADPGRTHGRVLLDPDGRRLARYLELDVDGRRRADLVALEPGVTPAEVAVVALVDLARLDVAGDEALGRELLARGARVVRIGHVMVRDLLADPPPAAWLDPPAPPGVVLEPATGPPAALAASWRAAFAPGHPDFHGQTERQTARELDALLRGAIIGPPLPCSVQARAADGRLCGAALVNAAAGAAPAGGPWLSELFRDPRVRGTGRALLRRALADASRDGLPTMGLVVTDGNPAEGLYREHGFARAVSSLTVRLP